MVEVAEATVKKWGSSLGIIIPKEVAEKEGIKDGEKVSVIVRKQIDLKKTKKAWKDLQKAGKEISKKWEGPPAVEEIREQRTKKW